MVDDIRIEAVKKHMNSIIDEDLDNPIIEHFFSKFMIRKITKDLREKFYGKTLTQEMINRVRAYVDKYTPAFELLNNITLVEIDIRQHGIFGLEIVFVGSSKTSEVELNITVD